MFVFTMLKHLLSGTHAPSALMLVQNLFRETGWEFDQTSVCTSNVRFDSHNLFIYAKPNTPYIFLSVSSEITVSVEDVTKGMLLEVLSRELSCTVGTWCLMDLGNGKRAFALQRFRHISETNVADLKYACDLIIEQVKAFDAKWFTK